MGKGRDVAALESDGRTMDVRTLEAHAGTLRDELDSFKRRESSYCDLEMISFKEEDAQSNITDPTAGLHQNTVIFLDPICHSVTGALVEVSKYPKKAFDPETRNLLQGVREAACAVAESCQGAFAGASGIIDKRLEVTIGRAARRSKSARPDTFSTYTTNRNPYADSSGSRTRSFDLLPSASMASSSRAHNLCDTSERGV